MARRPSVKDIDAAIALTEAAAAGRQAVICPLCERPIPPDAKQSRHHLIPRLKGGTHLGTVRLHQICHSAIHARFSETELATKLNDVAALRTDPELAQFIAWVQTKPPGFHAPTKQTRVRRQTRIDRTRNLS